jgi:hypothetical protein
MSRRRPLTKRTSGPPFVQLFHHVLDSREFSRLTPGARSLLLLFARRFKGHNNGNLEMTARQFREAGLGSEPTMRKYMAELINGGWIVVTRYGGMRSGPNLYALTYFGIDETNIEYDPPYKADTMALHLWKDERADRRVPVKAPKSRSGLERLPSARTGSGENATNVISFPSEREAA